MEMVKIYIMGKEYEVPKNLTIMRALEYSGYKYIRGCGCRGGFCGACGTFFRTVDDYKIKVGLACQTTVENGMYLTQIPFFPANKAVYDIERIKPTAEQITRSYPEINRCLSCNTCGKACPQEIRVMDFVQAALRGDIAKAADLSFDCIMCGLCAARCPAELVPYNIAIMCRRLYAKYLVPKASHLKKRIREIEHGKFKKELDEMEKMSKDRLREMYDNRKIEE